jgi:hypothetical protein
MRSSAAASTVANLGARCTMRYSALIATVALPIRDLTRVDAGTAESAAPHSGRHSPGFVGRQSSAWRHTAAKDRTFKTVRPNQGTASGTCSDPQTGVVVNHQDRPG